MTMIRALPSWTQLAWWSQRRHIESRHLPSPSISLDLLMLGSWIWRSNLGVAHAPALRPFSQLRVRRRDPASARESITLIPSATQFCPFVTISEFAKPPTVVLGNRGIHLTRSSSSPTKHCFFCVAPLSRSRIWNATYI